MRKPVQLSEMMGTGRGALAVDEVSELIKESSGFLVKLLASFGRKVAMRAALDVSFVVSLAIPEKSAG